MSNEFNEMHSGAADYEAMKVAMAEVNEADANEGAEAMQEARGNDGVRVSLAEDEIFLG